MADSRYLSKKDKLLYFSNGLTDFDEILHYIGSPDLKGCSEITFKYIQDGGWATAAILKNVKRDMAATVWPNFDAIYYDNAQPFQPDQRPKIWKSNMADGGHLDYRKIVISPKPLDRF